MGKAKADALRAIEKLPDDCTWEEIRYRLYVIEAGRAGVGRCRRGPGRVPRGSQEAARGMATVIWFDDATEHVRGIVRGMTRAAPGIAAEWLRKLLSAPDILTTMPQFGSVVDEFNVNHVRELLVGPYRLIYAIDGGHVRGPRRAPRPTGHPPRSQPRRLPADASRCSHLIGCVPRT